MTPAEKAAKSKAKRKPPFRRAVKFPDNPLRAMREKLGLSLRDVENETGVNNVTLFSAEAGCEIILTSALALARFYGLSVEGIWSTPK